MTAEEYFACGGCAARQIALDCVAEQLGEDRMLQADGYHYEAVKTLVTELGLAYARISELERGK